MSTAAIGNLIIFAILGYGIYGACRWVGRMRKIDRILDKLDKDTHDKS